LAAEAFGIPLYGTMPHSFIEAQDNDNVVLPLDT
jgi:nicotinic acid phosphoribosyltransferase